MAIVNGPFFGTFATGSFGKVLTVRALYEGNKFIFAQYKRYAGKRSQIQIDNAEVFRLRAESVKKLFNNFPS